jgi:serine/threonine-protein kinase
MEAVEDDVRVIGRYALHGELASGGMAAVHLGRLLGPVGFARTVAIKRLHSQYAHDPEFVAMFLDEARLVARIKHPNVVPTLDVVTLDGEIFLVMEYVHGVPVSSIMMALAKRKERMPLNIAVGIFLGVLEGLHAAHEAKSEEGTPLGVVHRDVSPQNVLLGADGVPRVLDFGIAKAVERIQTTEDGSFKGKLGYMPPDVLSGASIDRRADIWGAGVVFWEMLVGRRLFQTNESPHALIRIIVEGTIDPPSKRGALCSPEVDAIVLRALTKQADQRYQTAAEMGAALEAAASPASNRAIGEWLTGLLGDELERRAASVARMERASRAQAPSVRTVRTLASNRSSYAPGTGLDPTSERSERGVVNGGTTSAPVSYQPEPPRRRALLAVVLAIVGVLGVGLVFGGRAAWRRLHPPPAPTPVAVTIASASTPEASSATTTAAPPPSASAAAVPPRASASTSPSASGPTPPANTPLRPSLRSASGPPKSCVPPYTIGPPPDYIRKPKLECLPR